MKRILAICLLLCLVCALFACTKQDGLNGVTGGLGGSISQGSGDEPPDSPKQEHGDSSEPSKEEGEAPPAQEEGGNSAKEDQPFSGEDQDLPLEEEEQKDYSDYITVVSYNVKHFNLGASINDIIALIKQMDGDIVGLQEVSEDHVAPGNQVEILAKQCGYDYYYFCPSDNSGGGVGRYGSGILSRYPILLSENRKFSFAGGQDRRYSYHVLDVNGVEVAYFNTHLLTGLWQDTGKQFTELVRLAEGEKRPVIITGDFNLTVNQQISLLNLKKMIPLNGGPMGIFSKSDISYDNIIISAGDFEYYEDPQTVTNIKVIVSDASDHNPVYSHIKLK